jgi:hypothetical protein
MAKNNTNLKVGDKVKIVAATAGHIVPIGTKTVLTQGLVNNYYRVAAGATYNIAIADIVYDGEFDRASVEAEIAEAKAVIDGLKAKLKYLDETGKDTGDETEVKVYATLSLLENGGLSLVEKASAIAALING